jgi:hypothetical protein
MKKTMKRRHLETVKTKALLICLALPWAASVLNAAPIATAFTYQGKLSDGGSPATGAYDLRFTLYDEPSGGGSPAGPITLNEVGITNGLFTVQFDFGDNTFSEGARWLEMAVRPGDGTNAFTLLSPRQLITAAPLANYATSAGTANSALTAQTAASATIAGSVTWANITGKPAGFADGADNDTTYTAGAGLNLNAANQFGINFGANGASNAAARSDHNHFGQTWTGSSPGSGFNLFNASTNGRAITGRQGTGSGYLSLFGVMAGLWGDSHDGYGVFGSSFDGAGVYGVAADSDFNNNTTYGGLFQNNGYGFGVFASSDRGQAAHFQITDAANNSPALVATTEGKSHAGLFIINNSANVNDAVSAQTSGSGDAVSGFNSGIGHAGRFQIGNANNSSDAVHAETWGKGHGVHAQTSGTNSAIHAYSTGAGGTALLAKSAASGVALHLDGGAIRVTGSGAPVFVHHVTEANLRLNGYHSEINHPLCNNRTDAILITTQIARSNGHTLDGHMGVIYDSESGRWRIHSFAGFDEARLAAGDRFNVLVIHP